MLFIVRSRFIGRPLYIRCLDSTSPLPSLWAIQAPVGLIGLALLLWGWQFNLWIIALPLACLIEGAHFWQWRWQLTARDLYRIVDTCVVAFLIISGYAVFTRPVPEALFFILQWLPILIWPLMALQCYSVWEQLPLTALSLQKRWRGSENRLIDIGYPYAFTVVLCASVGNQQPFLFYVIMLGLVIYALWPLRNRRYTNRWTMVLWLIVAAGGYFGHQGLIHFAIALESQIPEWLIDWFERDTDPYRQTTRLGTLGELKPLSRIVLRVWIDPPDMQPSRHTLPLPPTATLLRTATYNVLNGRTWLARTDGFTGAHSVADSTWQLMEKMPSATSINSSYKLTILQRLPRGSGLLALPLGSYSASGIPARVEKNPLGTVKVTEAPHLIRYRVHYDPTLEDGAPDGSDRAVPIEYAAPLAEFIAQQGWSSVATDALPDRLIQHFASYGYTLKHPKHPAGVLPLVDFLTRHRAGHCEYFAAATVLLLRQLGIPARYAVGFSVQEYSPLEGRFIVRERHAHAWALAYTDGQWRAVDTTPALGWQIDAEEDDLWTGFLDVLSWFWVRIGEWQMHQNTGFSPSLLAIPLMLLVGVLIGRLRNRQRVRRTPITPTTPLMRTGPGSDSEGYLVLDGLLAWGQQQGWPRPIGMPLARWLQQHQAAFRDRLGIPWEELQRLIHLHYRYRFDPVGLSVEEREQLRKTVDALLKAF